MYDPLRAARRQALATSRTTTTATMNLTPKGRERAPWTTPTWNEASYLKTGRVGHREDMTAGLVSYPAVSTVGHNTDPTLLRIETGDWGACKGLPYVTIASHILGVGLLFRASFASK